MALKASAPFHSAVGKQCKRREYGTHTRTGRLVCGDLTEMLRLWFGVVLDGTLYQACLTEGRALRQLLYALHHFVHVVDAGNNGVILEW